MFMRCTHDVHSKSADVPRRLKKSPDRHLTSASLTCMRRICYGHHLQNIYLIKPAVWVSRFKLNTEFLIASDASNISVSKMYTYHGAFTFEERRS